MFNTKNGIVFMEGKNSFVLYTDLIHTLEKVPDETAGKLFKVILDYVNDKNPEPNDLVLQVLFEPIKRQLKRDLQSWEKERIYRSDAGRKGGLAKASKAKQRQAKASKAKQPLANLADTVTVIVNVTVKEQIEKYKKESSGKYSEQMYSDFIRYWGEPFQNGKFKGKERWQGQDTWQLSNRLATWFSRSNTSPVKNITVPKAHIVKSTAE